MATPQIDLNSNDLCLIDSGISSLNDVPLRTNLVVLNLHGNYISSILNLQHLKLLKHLDLSSNQIRVIEGLDWLVSLKTLNLSCNLLSSVDGLSALRSLVKLNLSYNQIEDINGLRGLAGPLYRLACVELHGNRLSSVAHVAQCLCQLTNLHRLALSRDGSSNPVCHKPGYEQEVLSNLPQLQYLDGADRHGNVAVDSDNIADIPGLDDYLQYLLSNNSEPDNLKDSNTTNLITPKIDKALETFRHRNQVSSSDTSVIPSVTDTELSPSSSRRRVHRTASPSNYVKSSQDARLETLEQQISDLLNKAKGSVGLSSSSTGAGEESSSTVEGPKVTHHEAERDVDRTDSESEVATKASGPSATRRSKRSRLPGYRKSTTASRARKDTAARIPIGPESRRNTVDPLSA